MIDFRDFGPLQKRAAGFLKLAEFEDLRTALDQANAWIEAEGIDLLRIETVVLPNLHSPHARGSQDPELGVSGDSSSAWYQFFRVWYRHR